MEGNGLLISIRVFFFHFKGSDAMPGEEFVQILFRKDPGAFSGAGVPDLLCLD